MFFRAIPYSACVENVEVAVTLIALFVAALKPVLQGGFVHLTSRANRDA